MASIRLIIEGGPEAGRPYELTRSSIIGRATSCDLVVNDTSCSRMHVRVTPEGMRCRVEDLGSTNGTRVNGERVSLGYLNNGDHLAIGDTVMRFERPKFDGTSTVIIPGSAPVDARVAVEALTEGPIEIGDAFAPRTLEATNRLMEATRGVPERSSIARALCGATSFLLQADRAAVLLFRPGSRDPQDALNISQPEMRIDPDRPWINRALQKRRALLLVEEGAQETPLHGIVVPIFHGDEPTVLVYADRREGGFVESDITGVRHLIHAGLALIDSAAVHEKMRAELMEHRTRYEVDRRLIGESEVHQEVVRLVRRTGRGTQPVLFIGETGTGKAMFARFLHDSSVRAQKPFIIVNCSASPPGFLEAEILGTDRTAQGPYGADHIGCLERARGGTLFLDEIDALDLASQARLASVLREKMIRRESGREIPIDVRLVAASDRDLATLSAGGSFHEDLLALLAMGTIPLPPLRERREDIPLLADHFMKLHARRVNRNAKRLSAEAMKALSVYAWPGNVREISNVIERAVFLSKEEELGVDLLPISADESMERDDLALQKSEKRAIERALRFCNFKKGETAKVLGISWPTLNKKINDYDIEVPAR